MRRLGPLTKVLLSLTICVLILSLARLRKSDSNDRECKVPKIKIQSKEITIFGEEFRTHHECDAIERQLISLRVDYAINADFDESKVLIFCSYTSYKKWRENLPDSIESIIILRHYKTDEDIDDVIFGTQKFGETGQVEYVNCESSYNYIARPNYDASIVDNCKLYQPCSADFDKQWMHQTIRRYFVDDYRDRFNLISAVKQKCESCSKRNTCVR